MPALVDLETYEVVNNDYHRLTNYFETAFKPFQKADAPDLYPENLRQDIDHFNDNVLFPFVNNGVYRMMFAQSLVAYEEAFDDFFTTLDIIEKRLATQRFLFGDYVTDSDIRLYVTLARFDTHYYRNLGPIKHRIVDYPNIWAMPVICMKFQPSKTILISMILRVAGTLKRKNYLLTLILVLLMIMIMLLSGQLRKNVNTFLKHQNKSF